MIEKTDSIILFSLGMKFVLVYIILLMFDVLLDGLMAIIDYMIEFIHILIEVAEIITEEGLEHIFHTGHQQNEIIMFNVVLIVSGIFVVFFIKALPHLVITLKDKLLGVFIAYWARQVSQWRLYAILFKLKLLLVYILGFSGLTMLIG